MQRSLYSIYNFLTVCWKAVFLYSLFCVSSIQAQQYGFLNYTTDNGLAQSQVTGMCQDNNGYLWFSTYGGISRFDGIEFENYGTNDGLLNNQVHTLYKGRDGKIWFGGMGGFSQLYNGKIKSFALKNDLSQSIIISICEDKENTAWLLFDNTALMRIKNGKQKSYIIPDSTVTESRNCVVDNDGKILVSTNKGIYAFDPKTELFSYDKRFGEFNFSFITISNKQYAVSTFGDGVFIYNDKKQSRHLDASNGLSDDAVRHLFYDEESNLWISTISGVSVLENGKITRFNVQNGLSNNNIRFTAQDNEGNIWFGTDGKGVIKFTGRKILNFTAVDGLSGDLIMSILQEPNGTFWFGTYNDGITKLENGKYTHYNDADGISNNIIWSLARTPDGKIWMGTSIGLTMYDGKKFSTYYTEDGLLSNKITSLFCDEKGILWIGTKNGLNTFDGRNFKSYNKEFGISGSNIRCIVKDEKGFLWLAGSAGLLRFDGKKSKLFRFNETIEDNTVYSIKFDKYQNLWLGTQKGLFLFKDEKFIELGKREDAFTGNVNFLIDDDDFIWVGTNNGIFELNLEKFYSDDTVIVRSFDKNEGLKGRETNMNAAYKDAYNNLWFGTDGGLVRIGKDRNQSKTKRNPFIHITDVKIFFETPNWNKLSGDSINDFGFPSSARVKYNLNHFTFYFTGISLTQPQKLRYRFMLEGFDQDYLPLTETRYVTYSNLAPGDYTFKVIAQNANGLWSDQPSMFKFTVVAPFWKTWWFYSLCAFVFVASIIALWRFRLGQLKRKSQTMQLYYKSKLLALEQQSLNASMNRHFIFNSLNSIQYYINKQDKLEANRYLTNFAKLIRKNLDSSISSDLISLNEELERITLYLSLENMRFKDRFTYEIIIDPRIQPEKVMIPPMLFQPYIENSIWHGILPKEEMGHIKVNIYPNEKDADLVIIEITDDGIGLSNSLKNKVDTGSTHVSRGIEITSGRLGLLKKMTNQNLEIIGPEDITDASGKITGTSVRLIISVKIQPNTENSPEKLFEN